MTNADFSNFHGTLPGISDHTHLCLAPMQGVTHVYYRQLFERIGGMDALYTEFFNSASVSESSKRVRNELSYYPSQLPLVVQLIGADVQSLRKAAAILYRMGVRHFNLNAGCPYGRLSQKLAGGRMMKHPEILNEIVSVMEEFEEATFSVKIRIGYDDCRDFDSILPVLLRPRVSFVIIHCRLVRDGYRFPADWNKGAEMIPLLKPKPVIMNGDIYDVECALRVLHTSQASGLMLGRGAIRNPWLFSAIKRRLKGTEPSFWIHSQEVADFYQGFKSQLHTRAQPMRSILGPLKEIVAQMADLMDDSGALRFSLKRAPSEDMFEHLLFEALESWRGVRLY